jgi:hypothetical protein
MGAQNPAVWVRGTHVVFLLGFLGSRNFWDDPGRTASWEQTQLFGWDAEGGGGQGTQRRASKGLQQACNPPPTAVVRCYRRRGSSACYAATGCAKASQRP